MGFAWSSIQLYRGSGCRWNTAVDIKTGKWETFVLYQWADKLGVAEIGDRLFRHAPGSRKPSWNKQISFLLCDGWMKRWWLYWWLEGVSQTTEQKEKHMDEKQSHLTSWGRLQLKFRSRYSLPEVCRIVTWKSQDANALPRWNDIIQNHTYINIKWSETDYRSLSKPGLNSSMCLFFLMSPTDWL